jgi:proline iminopeptidase
MPDARIFYEVVGSGAPIVIVHGGPGLDHSYLRPGLDVLGGSHALVYFDQRGTGRSDAELDSASINLDAFVGDIDALREALGHERIILLGHSFGGLIALAYARTHPERTRALVLVSSEEPGSRFRDQTEERARRARTPADSAELAQATASPAFAARDAVAMTRMYRAAFRTTLRDPRRVGELRLDLSPRTAQNGPDVRRLLGNSLLDVDWWDDLALVHAPALVVHGRFDAPPLAMAQALASALPAGRLVVLETGHFPYVEDPSALLAAVATFLAAVPP